MISSAMGIWNYWIVFILMMIGLFLVIGRKNFLKKIVGLTIFQTSVFLLYITFGKITGATPPILNEALDTVYSNPLPHVLILTAIVVGVATTTHSSGCGEEFADKSPWKILGEWMGVADKTKTN